MLWFTHDVDTTQGKDLVSLQQICYLTRHIHCKITEQHWQTQNILPFWRDKCVHWTVMESYLFWLWIFSCLHCDSLYFTSHKKNPAYYAIAVYLAWEDILVSVTKVNSRCKTAFVTASTTPSRLSKKKHSDFFQRQYMDVKITYIQSVVETFACVLSPACL